MRWHIRVFFPVLERGIVTDCTRIVMMTVVMTSHDCTWQSHAYYRMFSMGDWFQIAPNLLLRVAGRCRDHERYMSSRLQLIDDGVYIVDNCLIFG